MLAPTQAATATRKKVSDIGQSAERGLDLLNLWVAIIQTGFGPFVAVYLTANGWTQTALGLALSLGTLTAMISQAPAGALVDATRRPGYIAGLSLAAFAVSALMFAIRPSPLFVYGAEILHGFSSCTLGPSVAAMSLALAGQAAMGERLGRNARFASIGNGVGAALMGAAGYYVSDRSVFFFAAAITLPAFLALMPLSRVGAKPAKTDAPASEFHWREVGQVLGDRRLVILALCAALFTLSDSAMLPLAGSGLTQRNGSSASLLIAACIVLPQIVVALLSPYIGRLTGTWGRRPVLLIGFCTLPVRGALFAMTGDPGAVIAIQLLNGIASASFLIMIPLITSDIAGRTRHFTLALGTVGIAIGIGGTFSTTLAGYVSDTWGKAAAFLTLAGVALVAIAVATFAMPETMPDMPARRRRARQAGEPDDRLGKAR